MAPELLSSRPQMSRKMQTPGVKHCPGGWGSSLSRGSWYTTAVREYANMTLDLDIARGENSYARVG